MKNINADIVIIGGGASGLMAAICAAKESVSKNKCLKIIILEKQSRIGKKILVTGNGRCNLLNTKITVDSYNFSAKNFLNSIFKKFSPNMILDFFYSIGLLIKIELDGRVYPFSGQASSVLDLLRLQLNNLKVLDFCDFYIKDIKKINDNFEIISDETKIYSKKVILAPGGKASLPNSFNFDIFSIIKKLGHTITPHYPALVPIETNSGFEKSLKGIRTLCYVHLLANNKLVRKEFGEIQFTQSGLSGICIFQISRMINEYLSLKTINGTKYENIKISLDLLPITSEKVLFESLHKKIKSIPGLQLDELFIGILNKKLGSVILKSCNIKNSSGLAKNFSTKDLIKIVKTTKNFEFTPIGSLPFKNAQVMSGGINLSEINSETMESLKCKNLYFCGEVLDVDGDCGGFNLYWAWLSGLIAGTSSCEF